MFNPGKLKTSIVNYLEQKKTKSKVKTLLDSNSIIKLEIGSGSKKGENGWQTLDMANLCDLKWDLRLGIPFPNDSINAIYSSHFFEHLTFQQINTLMQECRRALKQGGIFSICVPNARLYLEAYLNKDENNFWKRKAERGLAVTAFNNTTSIDYANYVAYMDNLHKYMFDQENLICILQQNGFRNARIRSFDSTLDLEERDFDSIYAIAEK